MRRSTLIAVVIILAGAIVLAVVLKSALEPKPDPARLLFGTILPDWQVARARPNEAARSEASRRLLEAAAPWPDVAGQLGKIDSLWPDDKGVRGEVTALNQTLRVANLRYWIDVQPIRQQPILLTYEVETRTPWRAGDRQVDVVKARRLDQLNIEMGFLGETDAAQPVVYLDRLEADLVMDLAQAYGKSRDDGALARRALGQWKRIVEARGGAQPIGRIGAGLIHRHELIDGMRARLRVGRIEVDLPEALVLGDGWFERLAPYTDLRRPGGPLFYDVDLKKIREADEALRAPELARAFAAALDLFTPATEAHEARHALQPEDETPPAILLDQLQGDDPHFAVMADRELRAYLGELHDAAAPPCLLVVQMVRGVYGVGARPTPHYFARRAILQMMGDNDEAEPADLLDHLCALPDEELRRRAATTWRKLYGVDFLPAHPEH